MHKLLGGLGAGPRARWRSESSLERYLRETAVQDESTFQHNLLAEVDDCRECVIDAWAEQVSDLEELLNLSTRRLHSQPELKVVFKSAFRTSAAQKRLERAKAWLDEAGKIEAFPEFVDFCEEYLIRTASWCEDGRDFIRDFDKTEGDQVRRKYAIRGFWLAVFAILISSALSVLVDVLGLAAASGQPNERTGGETSQE